MAPIREPICPPKNTAPHNKAALIKLKSPGRLVNCPAIPEIEFTKINTLAVAAIFLGVSQRNRFNRGDKNIQPPIPTIPESRPIAPPRKPSLT